MATMNGVLVTGSPGGPEDRDPVVGEHLPEGTRGEEARVGEGEVLGAPPVAQRHR